MQQKPLEKKVLVLQGGGALGAYQAGAFEALAQAGEQPDWLAGISIGAINAALIAGNPPERRVARLREFWNKVSSGLQGASLIPGAQGRSTFNELSSWLATMFGIPGFFSPRLVSPLLSWPGTREATSFYDTSALKDTLHELVDFDLINKGGPRLSVGAVNVVSGNFRYFDSTQEKLRAEHIMASGALPPGFPAVEIDGAFYWDGGLVSNTPLSQVIDMAGPSDSLCIFQVDLFSARGKLPETIMETAEREKEIRYSSRTRMMTTAAMTEQRLRQAAANLLKKLPQDMAGDPDVKALTETSRAAGITVMHLINRGNDFDTQSKDYEFSRLSVEEHWQNGFDDAQRGLSDKAWKARAIPAQGMVTFDNGKVVRS
ncbi:MAG: patatin-like phospholipase family protein [Alphaproteobacteria bacterium]|nr:patatin-like phospholipase family protein [Alphaproteobacteria bacterium]